MNKEIHIKRSLRFRHWSRKAYAVFCSLGRVVTIGNLKKSAIDASMPKQHNSQGIIITENSLLSSFIKEKEKDEMDTGPNSPTLLLKMIMTMLQPQKVVVNHCDNILTDKFINKYAGRIHYCIPSAFLF